MFSRNPLCEIPQSPHRYPYYTLHYKTCQSSMRWSGITWIIQVKLWRWGQTAAVWCIRAFVRNHLVSVWESWLTCKYGQQNQTNHKNLNIIHILFICSQCISTVVCHISVVSLMHISSQVKQFRPTVNNSEWKDVSAVHQHHVLLWQQAKTA